MLSDLRQAASSTNLFPDRNQDFTYGSGQNSFKGGPTRLMNISELALSITSEFLASVMLFILLNALSHSDVEMGIVSLEKRI